MSGWTSFEVHSLNGEFSEDGTEVIIEKLESGCDRIEYVGEKRIVGILGGYSRYPNRDLIDKVSKYEDVAVAICVANDTSDTGETELFIDNEKVQDVANDNYCKEAMRSFQDEYGIFLYASRWWHQISCETDIMVDEKREYGLDGYVSVRSGMEDGVEVTISESPEESDGSTDYTIANLSTEETEQLIRELEMKNGS